MGRAATTAAGVRLGPGGTTPADLETVTCDELPRPAAGGPTAPAGRSVGGLGCGGGGGGTTVPSAKAVLHQSVTAFICLGTRRCDER